MLYKAPNGVVGSRPNRIGRTFIGSQTDLTQYGYLPVTPDKPTAPDGQQAVTTDGSEVNGEWQVTWVFEAIPPVSAPDYGTKITRLAMKLRMTATERKTIRAAAETNADVYDFMDLLSDSTYIDLTRPETVQGIQTLEAAGLLGAGRADEILTDAVTEQERWTY
jgi:hypothetical protein